MKYLKYSTQVRFFSALILVFISTILVYTVMQRLYKHLAPGLTIAWSTSIIIYIMHRWRVIPPTYDTHFSDIRSIINLQSVINGAFLPLGSWAMEPNHLLYLLSIIQLNRYQMIVECGSGVSTVAIGNLLMQTGGGHLYSLEEDRNWFSIMKAILVSEGLSDYVTLIHAPLEDYPDIGAKWYTLRQVHHILHTVERIDLLLVDGPKSDKELSRYPALPTFAPFLDSCSLIVLDDSNRSHERSVIKAWRESFDLLIEEPFPNSRGQAYIRLRS